MTPKQIIFIFIAFIFALAVLTMPLWADSLLPYFNRYLQSVVERVQEMVAAAEK